MGWVLVGASVAMAVAILFWIGPNVPDRVVHALWVTQIAVGVLGAWLVA